MNCFSPHEELSGCLHVCCQKYSNKSISSSKTGVEEENMNLHGKEGTFIRPFVKTLKQAQVDLTSILSVSGRVRFVIRICQPLFLALPIKLSRYTYKYEFLTSAWTASPLPLLLFPSLLSFVIVFSSLFIV